MKTRTHAHDVSAVNVAFQMCEYKSYNDGSSCWKSIGTSVLVPDIQLHESSRTQMRRRQRIGLLLLQTLSANFDSTNRDQLQTERPCATDAKGNCYYVVATRQLQYDTWSYIRFGDSSAWNENGCTRTVQDT